MSAKAASGDYSGGRLTFLRETLSDLVAAGFESGGVNRLIQIHRDYFGREAMIVPAAGDTLDVEQMRGADVVGSDVLPAGAAAKGHRGLQRVIGSSQSALRGGCVDQDAPGIHGRGEVPDALFIG